MDAKGAKISGNVSGVGNVRGSLSQQMAPTDYERLQNKPSIEGNVLIGDKTFKQLGLDTLSVQEIEKILYLD